MPIRIALWMIDASPQPLKEAQLSKEQQLEDMIVAEPGILSSEWMIIGRQEETGSSGRIDLLAIAPDGSLVLIEIKRDRTPREVVAQALDYASWVATLRAEDIAAIYGRFKPGKSFESEFQKQFGHKIDEDELNQNHQIVIVAASLDDSTERIVTYLNDRDIPINVLYFQVFTCDTKQLLSRAWLLDPVRTQISTAATSGASKEPWNGEFYCSFGHGATRSWDDARDFEFVCAGGGAWYSKTLQLLNPGDRIWVKVPGSGFVGVGQVTGHSQPASTFKVNTSQGETPVLEVAKRGSYNSKFLDDPERCEYFVPVKWLETVPLEKSVKEIGMFGNQNTVCKPTTVKWRATVEQLKAKFPKYDQKESKNGAETNVQTTTPPAENPSPPLLNGNGPAEG